MKKRGDKFFQIMLFFLIAFGNQGLSWSSQREGSKMGDLVFYDRIKKEAKFEAWGGENTLFLALKNNR